MSVPCVLFVRPGAVKPSDKSALRKAGVVVVEVKNPDDVKFVRPESIPPELSHSALLAAAMEAVVDGRETARFGAAVARMIRAAHDDPAPSE